MNVSINLTNAPISALAYIQKLIEELKAEFQCTGIYAEIDL